MKDEREVDDSLTAEVVVEEQVMDSIDGEDSDTPGSTADINGIDESVDADAADDFEPRNGDEVPLEAPSNEDVSEAAPISAMPMTDERLKAVLEGALFAAGRSLTAKDLMALFVANEHEDQLELGEPPTITAVLDALTALKLDYAGRGVELKQTGSGYRFQVVADSGRWVSRLWAEKPQKYSRALLETLALIAYRQPITRGEIEDVRGVAVSSHIIKTLIERDWIRVVGHRDVPGRPAMFATTKAFLDYFNLASLEELPPLSAIKDLDSIAALFGVDNPVMEPVADASADGEESPQAEDERGSEDQLMFEGGDESSVSVDVAHCEDRQDAVQQGENQPTGMDVGDSEALADEPVPDQQDLEYSNEVQPVESEESY